MARFFQSIGPSGLRHINLDLVREVVQDVDGTLTLRFDRNDEIKLDQPDAGNCMHIINQLGASARR